MNKETYLNPFILTANNFKDDRGEFSPLVIKEQFPDFKIVQANTVVSNKPYTFRGMHWQEPPYAQAKLIRCLVGHIIDYVVDIRKDSPNFGKAYSFSLNDKNTWVYVPEGFAHAYLTLPHNLSSSYPTLVEYLINNDYNKESERGMWMTKEVEDMVYQEIGNNQLVINERDLVWPSLDLIETKFRYEIEK